MKFIKAVKTEDRSDSILYDASKNAYYLSRYGETIGIGVCDKDQFVKILADDTKEIAKELGLNESVVFSPAGEYDVSLDNKNEFLFNVRKNEQINQLPYGSFIITRSNYGIIIKPFQLPFDTFKRLKNHDISQIVEEFFTNKVETFRKNKKNILLYGPPGNGKTIDIHEMIRGCAEKKRRVFFVESGVSLRNITEYRDLLGKDETIFIFEEMTERLQANGVEDILTFLDGENSWDNCVCIGTTNYPDQLPANIVDRPGRFDTFIEYKLPSNEEIEKLAELYGVLDQDYKSFYGKGLSFDYVSFVMDKAKKENKTFDTVITEEKEKRRRLSETFKGKMGL